MFGQDSIDATKDFDNVLKYISDPNQAEGIFLDWWADRVGVSRTLETNGTSVLLTDCKCSSIETGMSAK